MRHLHLLVLMSAVTSSLLAVTPHLAHTPVVDCYRLKTPDGEDDIRQASGLHYGRIGEREGLWLVCDRNGGDSGNRIFHFSQATLDRAEADKPLAATVIIGVSGPADGWEKFDSDHAGVDVQVLRELHRQIENGSTDAGPILDLEGVTIAPCSVQKSGAPPQDCFYVVAEQPSSVVLELRFEAQSKPPRAALNRCWAYREDAAERGGDANDGLEGIAWTGRPGAFFLAEEGTRPHRAGDSMHFFDHPRLLRGLLADGQIKVLQPWSGQATRSVWAAAKTGAGATQTLNDLSMYDQDVMLAVDRNGGWILAIDVRDGTARRYLNLYDPEGLNLRQRLANLPAERHLPYVSIEGIARDKAGDLWLTDDPAMPEGFRESVLIRLRNPPPLPVTSSAGHR